ncbi:MAG TPA: FliA/WhiG family RNA polymerase sigma factor [Candidatus Gastranaerophilales bacterium]|nr:FliA/WhiG family RNA polymerase sigma factor [Candidatus Gastranaerophilales bacterium]
MGFSSDINIDTFNNKQKKLPDSEINKIWEEFEQNRNNKQLRDKLIIQYIYLIKYVVGRLRISLPATITTEDMASYGVEGLIDAIEKFMPSKGVRFETYALLRIRGAVIDRIRSFDWIPRGAQKRFKQIQLAMSELQGQLGRAPSIEEIAKKLELPKEKVEASMMEMESNTLVSLYDKRDSSSESIELIDTIQDKRADDPLAQLENRDVKNELSKALSKLPERERMILALYYHENMTLKEIGAALNISESRVCQLHAQAIMKLRKLLSSQENKSKSLSK